MSEKNGNASNANTNDDNAGSSAPVNWKDQLGDLANHDRVKGFSSIKELVQAYANQPVPPSIPESSDGYTLPEKIKVKGLRKMAHENKLSQKQLDGILSFNEQSTKKAIEEMNEQRKSAIASLRKDWGDDYDSNMKSAQQALKSLDQNNEMSKFLATTGMADDPRVAKFLHRIGSTMGEGGFIGSDGNVKKKAKSKAERIFPNHKP